MHMLGHCTIHVTVGDVLMQGGRLAYFAIALLQDGFRLLSVSLKAAFCSS